MGVSHFHGGEGCFQIGGGGVFSDGDGASILRGRAPHEGHWFWWGPPPPTTWEVILVFED